MVTAASVSHGRQHESVHSPRRWYFCAWRRLPGSRSETVEDYAGEEAPSTTTMGTGSSTAYEVVNEADALRWTSAPM